jgi:hypothetical protein
MYLLEELTITALRFWNTPDGNRGIVQVQPTNSAQRFLNTPNGSWGIVQVQPAGFSQMVRFRKAEGRT